MPIRAAVRDAVAQPGGDDADPGQQIGGGGVLAHVPEGAGRPCLQAASMAVARRQR
jgi:hypothetical protein